MPKTSLRLFLVCLPFLAGLLTACSAPAASPTSTPTVTPTLAATRTPTPTLTLTPSPTRTPPALPGIFQVSLLNRLDTPHPYLTDTCQTLLDKWSSRNSPPGTVAMTIMFHSITPKAVTSPDQISEFAFRQLMNGLHDKGFQAITVDQLLAFLQTNAKIPEHSVVIIVDDRRTQVYFNAWFRKYWQEWGWPVNNAWISAFGGGDAYLPENVRLEEEGWVDHQAHGFQHMPSMGPSSSDAYIQQELQKPLQVFQEYFHKKPVAIIWPGGGFTPHTVDMARQAGYELGFTTNPRGPVMFNWVPLTDSQDVDPAHPTWISEAGVTDPLMVLPRYWSSDALVHLDEVIQIGQQAAAYAGQNRSTELQYYDIVCASKYGPIP